MKYLELLGNRTRPPGSVIRLSRVEETAQMELRRSRVGQ